MPAKLTIGNLTAHDRYFKSMGSPTIYDNTYSTGRKMASKRTSVTVPTALNAPNVSLAAQHVYPKPSSKELAMLALRDGVVKVNFRNKKEPVQIDRKKCLKTKEQANKGVLSCKILGGKKRKTKKRKRKTKRKTKRRHRTKRRVKKHRKRKTRRKR
jgi:hypothetical protein